MKKVLILILTMGFILTSGCAKPDNTPQDSSEQVYQNINEIDSANNKSNITDTETIDNSFFFKNNISQLNYKGNVFTEIVGKGIKLRINKVADLKYGKLYELKLDSIKDVPSDRLNLGYFYIQKDKIYKIVPTEENLNKLKTSEKVPNNTVIVCQEEEIKDRLGDEPGWHYYIVVNGDKCEYHSYNNQVCTGYYETFIWEKNKGLIYYRSGFGAERDSIELQLSND